MTRVRAMLPSMVSAFRVAASVVLGHAILAGLWSRAMLVLVCAAATDLADGALARRLGAATRQGAWIDVCADFTLVGTGFAALAIAQATPAWVPLLLVAMFALFVLSSGASEPAYDPVGKYYGGFLYGVLFVTLIARDSAVGLAAPVAVAGMSAASLASRAVRYRRTSISVRASSVSPSDVKIPRTR